jgi:hypothetical protein
VIVPAKNRLPPGRARGRSPACGCVRGCGPFRPPTRFARSPKLVKIFWDSQNTELLLTLVLIGSRPKLPLEQDPAPVFVTEKSPGFAPLDTVGLMPVAVVPLVLDKVKVIGELDELTTTEPKFSLDGESAILPPPEPPVSSGCG